MDETVTAPRGLQGRFAWAILVIAAVLVLAGLGAGAVKASGDAAPVSASASDAQLYSRIVQGVSRGENYYLVAPRELRRGAYPLRPFMAVRPPTLSVALAQLPDAAARRGALALLALATLGAWGWRLRGLWRTAPVRYAWTLALLVSGAAPALAPQAHLFHEVWAGLLIALSLALHRPGRWGASVGVGLAAGLLRELAIPYLGLMALLALLEGRRTEAGAWAGAVGLVLAALAGHAWAVTAVTTPGDLRSPGWLGLGGWPFVLQTARWNLAVCALPVWAGALVVPAAAAGLLLRPELVGRRVGLVAIGFMAGFCVVGRPDNTYWGLMIAPLWPLGLMYVDRLAVALVPRGWRRAAAFPAPRTWRRTVAAPGADAA